VPLGHVLNESEERLWYHLRPLEESSYLIPFTPRCMYFIDTASVADPDHFDAVPDPTFHLNTDSDPTFHFDTDTDPTI
jgi:hypothetical protein